MVEPRIQAVRKPADEQGTGSIASERARPRKASQGSPRRLGSVLSSDPFSVERPRERRRPAVEEVNSDGGDERFGGAAKFAFEASDPA